MSKKKTDVQRSQSEVLAERRAGAAPVRAGRGGPVPGGHVQAQLRVIVKRILQKDGYPQDKQEKATQTELEQTALSSGEWALG